MPTLLATFAAKRICTFCSVSCIARFTASPEVMDWDRVDLVAPLVPLPAVLLVGCVSASHEAGGDDPVCSQMLFSKAGGDTYPGIGGWTSVAPVP